jgi:hypothetical protein
MNSIRRHLNYANVVATMALVFAMSGTALAAKHYLISSTKQIKPSVLKSLEDGTMISSTKQIKPSVLKSLEDRTGPRGPVVHHFDSALDSAVVSA